MGRIPETVKIGAFVILAAVGIWGSVVLINGNIKSRGHTYPLVVRFKDATGVSKGMDVTAAGSPIGYVEGLPKFDKDQRLTVAKLRINKDVTVYKKSRFIIAQNGLLGEKILTLEDPLPQDRTELAQPDDVFDGVTEGDLQTIVARADDLLDEVHQLIGPNGLGGTFKDLGSTLTTSMTKVNGITDRVDTLLADNSVYMNASMKNFQAMSGNMVRLSANLQDASVGIKQLTTDPANHDQLKAVLANLNQASANMNTLTNQMNSVIGDPTVQQNTKDTLRLSKETLEETKKTIQQFQGTLTGLDSTMQKVNTLSDTTTDAIGRINRKLGGKPTPPHAKDGTRSPATKSGVPSKSTAPAKPASSANAASCGKGHGKDDLQVRLTADQRWVDQNRSGRVDRGDRAVGDVNAAVGTKGVYAQAGVDNIGDGGDINLLAGLGSLNGGSARAGVYRGQFGAGLAWYTKGFGAELTGYDPRHPKLDATGYIGVGESVDIIVGVQDATNTPKVTAGVGVKFK